MASCQEKSRTSTLRRESSTPCLTQVPLMILLLLHWKNILPQRLNTVAERHAFHKHTQARHKLIIQYIAALRDLPSTCESGDHTDEMIRNQLTENACNLRIRERLFLETEITLQRAITLATQMEAAAHQAKAIADMPAAPVLALQKTSKRKQTSNET